MDPSTNEPKSFLDARTIIAFVLTIGFFLGWHWYIDKKYPNAPATAQVAAHDEGKASGKKEGMPAASLTPVGGEQSPTAGEARALTGAPGPERLINFVSPQLSFQISSRGMGLKSIDVKTYKTRADEPVILGAVNERLPFGTELVDSQSAIDFSVEKAADNVFVGRAKIGEMEITKTLKIDPALYAMDVSVSVKNPTPAFKGLQTTLSEPLIDPKSSTFLVPSYDRQDFFLRHDAGKTERKVISKDKGISLDEKNVGLMAFSSHYFTLAIVDSKILLPRFETRTSAGAAETTGRLIYEPINPRENFEIRFKAYAGPKSFEAMDKVDPELATVIDHGMFGVFGKPLWSLLKFCFSISGNYGLAIILMTLVVRLCVMPFNVYSFRSMKAMQRIQPQINALKERYKDDPRTMNAEVMSLMKANKANPLGGCIPVLLQLPIFFAFYQVLGQSIELYRAPFIFWIRDLSMNDHYYVLPALMAAAMFTQQKLTPTAMDPAQAKVMMWMPLLFAFFMLSLPSGLTLYILVSTLFGIAQQLILSRDRTSGAQTLPAKAQAG